MKLSRSYRKAFNAGLRAGRKATKTECLNSIQRLIKRGDLPGDGTDRTAERNGLILASNTIYQLGAK